MSSYAPFIAALRNAGLDEDIVSRRNLSGGCIHTVTALELQSGTTVVAKVSESGNLALFEEEVAGLNVLAASRTVRVPRPITALTHAGIAVLLLEYLPPTSVEDDTWEQFGEELAQLHRAEADSRYGFEMDNHLGSTPQPNAWADDWVVFNAERRLGHQRDLAAAGELLTAEELHRLDSLIARLDQILPRRPKPALLHGDLWSGNALPTTDGRKGARIAVIDPAVSIGDGWADIAMMKLFGGFPEACYEAYAANVDDHENLPARLATYQLYHVLNHVNIFGRGYAGQAMSLLRRLGI